MKINQYSSIVSTSLLVCAQPCAWIATHVSRQLQRSARLMIGASDASGARAHAPGGHPPPGGRKRGHGLGGGDAGEGRKERRLLAGHPGRALGGDQPPGQGRGLDLLRVHPPAVVLHLQHHPVALAAHADARKVIGRSAFDLQKVLDTLVASAATLCEAEKACIFLRRGEDYHWVSNFGFSQALVEYAAAHPFRVGGGAATSLTRLLR